MLRDSRGGLGLIVRSYVRIGLTEKSFEAVLGTCHSQTCPQPQDIALEDWFLDELLRIDAVADLSPGWPRSTRAGGQSDDVQRVATKDPRFFLFSQRHAQAADRRLYPLPT